MVREEELYGNWCDWLLNPSGGGFGVWHLIFRPDGWGVLAYWTPGPCVDATAFEWSTSIDMLTLTERAHCLVDEGDAEWSWKPPLRRDVQQLPIILSRKQLPFQDEFRRTIDFPSDFPIEGGRDFDVAEDLDELPSPLGVVAQALPPSW